MSNRKFSHENIFKKFKIRLVVDGIVLGVISGLSSILYRFIIHLIDSNRSSLYKFTTKNLLILIILGAIFFYNYIKTFKMGTPLWRIWYSTN